MRTATHFYILAVAVGVVQGGAQALSRSLFGSMVPRGKSAEFFGFFSMSSRFAGIVGPLVFGLVGQFTGTSRLGILALVAFFGVGSVLLLRVDVDRGRQMAGEENARV
jgi:UMF1 family MFS transporter